MSLPAHAAEPAEAVPEVSHEELVRILADGSAAVVDVLARESYVAGHIPGALSLPLADLPDRAPRLFPKRARPLVAYCGGFT